MPTQISFFTLSLVLGHAEPVSAFLTVFGGGKTFADTTFYSIVDIGGYPDTGKAEEVQNLLRKSIGNAAKSSLTGAMERAITDVYRRIKATVAMDQQPTLLCAALRASEIYVACRGDATALALKDGGVRRLEFASDGEEVSMERMDLAIGEALVLGNRTLAESIPEEAEGPVLDAEPDEAARRVYLLARGYPQVSAIFFRSRYFSNSSAVGAN